MLLFGPTMWLALGFFEKEKKSLLLSKKESYVIVIQYIKKTFVPIYV